MQRLNTTIGFTQTIHNSPIPQCVNCLHRKQTSAPLQKVKNLPDNIRDIVVSDLCSPFKTSIGCFRYFITWINLKSWFTNIEFLKNKECDTIFKSFKHYLAWLLWQKKADVKKIRTDNRGEYTGKEFQHICSKLSIIHETTFKDGIPRLFGFRVSDPTGLGFNLCVAPAL